jgi:aminoglycoside 6'-N-acetyltransferase I
MISIRRATNEDLSAWLTLRQKLWPHCAEERHLKEIKECLLSNKNCALVAYNKEDLMVGFCECGLRHDYVEGSTSSPTAYLEGIYVLESFRNLGIAKELIKQSELWGKENGCLEMGSDIEIANHASITMHTRLGFKEKGRIVHFIKPIS